MTTRQRIHGPLRVEELESRLAPSALAGVTFGAELANRPTTCTQLGDLTFRVAFGAPQAGQLEADGAVLAIDGTKQRVCDGMPILPYRAVNLLLPARQVVGSVSVSSTPGISLGAWSPEIGSAALLLSESDEGAPPPVLAEGWAPEMVGITGIQRLAGYSILSLALYPVQYDPATCQATFVPEITFTVNTVAAPSGGEWRSTVRDNEMDRSRVAELVENPSALAGYAVSSPAGAFGPSPLVAGGPYDYVIITSEALQDAFAPLRDHKISRGVSATIVTTEYIQANYYGGDAAGSIREFIRDAYLRWNTNYVLLGGDIGVVAYRGAYANAGCYADGNIPCDMYFSCLDGSWNSDGDNQWGEETDGEGGGSVDLLAEVYVGRAPVDTLGQAANFVNKTIHYENGSHTNMDAAVLIGEHLWEDVYGSDSMELIRNEVMPSGYRYETLYEENGTFSSANVIAALSDGPHIVNHLGHGNSSRSLGIYTSDVIGSLTNTDPFFAYSQACYSGNFAAGDCIAENLVYDDNGAFAVVMNSRYGFGSGSHTPAYSHDFAYAFFQAVYKGGHSHLGQANQDSKEANLPMIGVSGTYRWICYELNLLGDPETSIGAPRPPRIGSLSASPNPAMRSDLLTLTANNVVSETARIRCVEFYADLDHNGIGAESERVGIATEGTDGWWCAASLVGMPLGPVTFLARATDTAAGHSPFVATVVTILNAKPWAGPFDCTPNPIVRGDLLTLRSGVTRDIDGWVTAVSFFLDLNDNGIGEEDELLGTATTCYLWWEWQGPTSNWAVGPVRLLTRALDNDGALSDFSELPTTVVNHVPDAGTLTASPSPLYRDETVLLRATGFGDPDGRITEMAFYRDANGNGVADPGELLGRDTDGQDGWTWTGTALTWGLGTQRFLCQATDNDGATSRWVSKTATVLNRPPGMGSLGASLGTFLRGDTIALTAGGVADSDGTVTGVSFYLDLNHNHVGDLKELLGTDVSGADGWSWTGSTLGWPCGAVELLARADDNNGAKSEWASTWVEAQNQAPAIALLSASPTAVLRGASIRLTAAGVQDNDGAVARVDFYRDLNGDGVGAANERIASDTRGTDGWFCLASTAGWDMGPVTLLAQATDSNGAVSPWVSVAVSIGNHAPVVGAVTCTPHFVAFGKSIVIRVASVTDTDGTVKEAAFYRDANGDGVGEPEEALGTDTSGLDGWSCVVSTAQWPLGDAVILVRASDNEGAQSEWTVANVVVRPAEWDPVVLDKAHSTFTFTDADGDLIKLTFTGPGEADIYTDSLRKPNGEDICHIDFYATGAASGLLLCDMSARSGPNTLTAGEVQILGGASLGALKVRNAGGEFRDTAIHVEGGLAMLNVIGNVQGMALDVAGDMGQVVLSAGLSDSGIRVGGKATRVQIGGAVAGTAVNIGGDLTGLLVRGAVTNSTFEVGGNAKTLQLAGKDGLSASNLSVQGNVGTLSIAGQMAGRSSVHVDGATGTFGVGQGIVGASLVRLDGDVTTMNIIGRRGEAGVERGASVALGGNLLRSLSVKEALAGEVRIEGVASAARITVRGDLTGSLLADVFGNVTVMGSFGGSITAQGPGSKNTLRVTTAGGGGVVDSTAAFAAYVGYP